MTTADILTAILFVMLGYGVGDIVIKIIRRLL